MEAPPASNLLENAARTHHPLHAVLDGFALFLKIANRFQHILCFGGVPE